MASIIDTFNYIYFYNINIFNLVRLETLHAAQTVQLDEDDNKFDHLACTEADEPICTKFIDLASAEVFRAISSMAHGYTDSYQYNVDIQTVVSTLNPGIGFIFIFTLPDNFDENQTEVLDKHIEKAIIAKILTEWWRLKKVKSFEKTEQENYNEALKEIKTDISLRIEPVRRPHSML